VGCIVGACECRQALARQAVVLMLPCVRTGCVVPRAGMQEALAPRRRSRIQACNGASRPAAGCDDVHPGGDLSTYGNGGHKSRGVWARPYR